VTGRWHVECKTLPAFLVLIAAAIVVVGWLTDFAQGYFGNP
jgi:hypothetical protein